MKCMRAGFAILFVAAPAFASDGLTGLYSLSPTENTSDVGLGGATLTRFASPGAYLTNPAALPLQDRSLGIAAGLPSSAKLPSGENELRQASSAGGNFRTGTPIGALGIGVGVTSSDISTTIRTIGSSRLSYSSRDFEARPAFGLRVFDELSLGLSPIFSFGSEKVAQERPSLRIEEHSYTGTAWQLSAIFSEAWFRGAIAWQSDSLMDTKKKVVPFEGSSLGAPYKPAQLRVGVGFALPPLFSGSVVPLKSDLHLQVDSTYFPGLRSGMKLYRPGTRIYNQGFALYSPYSASEERQEQALVTEARTVPRIGLETRLLALGGFRVNVNTGGYVVPAYAEGDPEKTHYTTGIALSFWGVRAEAAVDSAPGYRHLQFGLGASYAR